VNSTYWNQLDLTRKLPTIQTHEQGSKCGCQALAPTATV